MPYLKARTGSPKLYGIEGPWNIGDPVHENLALAALYQQRQLLGLSNCNFNALWADPLLNEYLRGVFWNDDPDVLLFDQRSDDDANFSSGAKWYQQFNSAEEASSNDLTNFTGRSHFWDMQYLHGMACVSGESPQTTQARILMWAELMYKVAIGQPVNGNPAAYSTTPENVAAILLSAVAIPETAPADPTLSFGYYFSSATKPKNTVSLKTLLTEGDPYTGLDIAKRALGTVMHMIQDSYARGHTRRVLTNPQDVQSQTTTSITFKPGTWGKWGSVLTFHTYRGQNHDEHKAFDEDSAPMDPTNPDSFNNLVGGRDAIEYCRQLLSYFANLVRWEAGADLFFANVFALDPGATPADTNVNRVPMTGVYNTGTGAVGTVDPHWKLVQSGDQTAPAYIVTANKNWINTQSSAKWISVAANTQGASNADFVYRTTIDLSGFNPSTVILSGLLAGDDQCTAIKVNGKAVYAPFGTTDVPDLSNGGYIATPNAGPGYTKYGGFMISGTRVFKPGINVIDFLVHNINGPTGLEVIFDTAVAVPA